MVTNIGGCNSAFEGFAFMCEAVNVWGCTYAFNSSCHRNAITGSIGWDAGGNSRPNTYDFNFQQNTFFPSAIKGTYPSAGLVLRYQNETTFYPSMLVLMDDSLTVGAWKAHRTHYNLEKSAVVRSGGAASSLKLTPLSNLAVRPLWEAYAFEWWEGAVPAGSRTRSLYIKGEGWGSTFPAATELYLEAEYYDQVSGNHKTTALSTSVLTQNGVWTEIQVAFAQAQAGNVRYRLYFRKYVAGAYLNVDAALYRDSQPPLRSFFGMWGVTLEQAQDSDWPAQGDVRSPVSFGFGAYAGLLDLPSVNDVRFGTTFDQASKSGLCKVPGAADVRAGVAVDVSGAGLLDIPAEVDVRLGTIYDNGSKTGTCAVPAPNNVKAGVPVDATVGTYDEDYPAEADVEAGVVYANGTMTGTFAQALYYLELEARVVPTPAMSGYLESRCNLEAHLESET
jgi:hypothetical protein